MKTAHFLAVARGRPVVRMDREQQALVAAGWGTKGVTLIPPKFTPIGNPVRRALEFRAMTNYLVKTVVHNERCCCLDPKADLIVAHDLDTLPAGVQISRELDIPLIYDAHEDWPLMIRNNSRLESKLANFIEMHNLRYVDHAVTAVPMPRFEKLGIPTTVLYNARPMSQIDRAWPADWSRDRARLGFADDDFVVGYAGNLEQYRGIADLLIGLLGRLPERFKFLIIGGPKEIADDIRQRWGTGTGDEDERLLVTGYLPYENLAGHFSAMDVGLVLMDDRQNHMESLPNKLFEYMAHGIPVIAPDGKFIGPLVREADCGWLVPEMTHDYLYKTLSQVAAMPKELMAENARLRFGRNGRLAFEERYCWDIQAPKWVEICERLTS